MGDEFDAFEQAAGSASGSQLKQGPVSGVNGQNYWSKAKAFVGRQGKGFMLRAESLHSTAEPATILEWGAWQGYFKSRGIPAHAMRSRGVYMVPCQWPHEFDADWSRDLDRSAANKYRDEIKRQREAETRRPPASIARAAAESFKAEVASRELEDGAKR